MDDTRWRAHTGTPRSCEAPLNKSDTRAAALPQHALLAPLPLQKRRVEQQQATRGVLDLLQQGELVV